MIQCNWCEECKGCIYEDYYLEYGGDQNNCPLYKPKINCDDLELRDLIKNLFNQIHSLHARLDKLEEKVSKIQPTHFLDRRYTI